MLRQLLKKLKPPEAPTSPTSSKRNLLDRENFPKPEVSESISQQQEEELRDTLLEFAKSIPFIKDIPDHPTLGRAPIEIALESHAAALARTVAQGVTLYAAAGGVAGIAIAGETDRLIVIYTDQKQQTIQFDLFGFIERRLLTEDESDVHESFAAQCSTIVKLMGESGWTPDVQERINSIYLAGLEGQLLVAWPLLTVEGGSKIIPQLHSVVQSLRAA